MRTSGLESDCFQSKAAPRAHMERAAYSNDGILKAGRASGVWWLTYASQVDIDCAEKNGFDETDKKYLEELAALLGRACDW